MKKQSLDDIKEAGKRQIKVLVVDDHPITRVGVHTILKSDSSIEVSGEAKDGIDAIRKVRENVPDIVIMDITMPELSGIDASREILKQHPEVKIIALSIHSGEKFVKEMLDAGAAGYLLKDDAAQELLVAIEKVHKGEMYLSSAVTKTALKVDSPQMSRVNVMKTKLLRPLITDQYVNRDRIIGELEQNIIKPVTIISAGPGYGKSIAASQWLEATNYPHAWITLDQEHNDLRTFLFYLKAAIEMVFPGSLRDTAKIIKGGDLPPINKLLYILFNDLCDIEKEVILVLDDYHKISESTIHNLFDEWLRLPPPNIHLCLVTRRDPPLNTELLKATGRISEIRMDKLSFSNEEIHLLFEKLSGIALDNNHVQALQEKTEGWIIALRLASMAVKKMDDVDHVLNTPEGGLKSISDYLVSEILFKLPPTKKRLLLISSLFSKFSVDLLKATAIESDEITADEFLEWLKTSNMFLIELDMDGTWYRYHHLFQLLLYDQLKKEQSEMSVKQLHAKVGRWFEENGLFDEAIHHTVLIHDYARAGEIIQRHRIRILNEGKWKDLHRLVQQVPDNVVEGEIDVMLAKAYSLMYLANLPELTPLVDRIGDEVDNLGKDSRHFGEFNFFKGYLEFILCNKMNEAMRSFEIAQKSLTGELGEPFANTIAYTAVVSQTLGRHEQANEELNKKIRASRNDSFTVRNKLFQGYLMSNTAEADLAVVEKYMFKAVEVARESKVVDSIGKSLMLTGLFYFRRGVWKTAINYLAEVLDHKHDVQLRPVIDSITGLVIARYLAGQRERSAEMLTQLEKLLHGIGDHCDQFLWSCKLRYYSLCNDRSRIRELLEQPYTSALTDLVHWFDIPAISYCRALLLEGGQDNLLLAEQKLEELHKVTSEQHNKIHLLEVYALQAILADKLGKKESATELLNSSFDISEPAGIIAFYVELGEPIVKILNYLPLEDYDRAYVKKILATIEDSTLIQKEPPSTQSPGGATDKFKIQLNALTQRELDVLQQVASGMRNQEIASVLCVSEDTVKKHLYNMFQKFHVKNRMSLVHKAKADGVIT